MSSTKEKYAGMVVPYKTEQQKREIFSSFGRCERSEVPKILISHYKKCGRDLVIRVMGTKENVQQDIKECTSQFVLKQLKTVKISNMVRDHIPEAKIIKY